MPVDPSISLGIATPQYAGANLGMMGQFAGIQNALNQATLFRQTFDARQQLGEIMATSPDSETAYQRMLQSPAAAFAPEVLTQNRAAMLASLQAAGETQKQYGTAMEGFIKFLPELSKDPSQSSWDAGTQLVLGGLSGPARQRAAQSMQAIGQGLITGLPADRVAASKLFNQRIEGLLTAGNVDAATQQYLGGRPETIATGSAQVPGWQAGLLGGSPGAFAPAGQSLPMGAPPSYGEIGGIPVARPAIPGGGVATPNALAPGGGAQGGGIQIPAGQIQEAGLAQQRVKFAADNLDLLKGKISAGNDLMLAVQEMRQAMKQTDIGPQAMWRAPLANAAAKAGFSQDIVDQIAGGSFGSMQELQKLFMQGATTQMRAAMPAGKYPLVEWESFQKANPNLETDPHAAESVFNFWQKQLDYANAEMQGFTHYLANKGDPFDWPTQWTKQSRDMGFTPSGPVTGEAKAVQPPAVPGGLLRAGPDGIYAPQTPADLQKVPKGAAYRRPGDPQDKIRTND